MENYLKRNIKWVGVNAITWSFSKQLFLAIQLWGVESKLHDNPGFPAGTLFAIIAFTGLLDGVIFGMLDVAFDKLVARIRFTERVLIKSGINLSVGLLLTMVLVPAMLDAFIVNTVDLVKILSTSNLIVLAAYMLLVTFLLQFAKVAAAWIQTQDIRQLFSRHDDTMEEDRIFMFLDMKSSTSHAETLGAMKYSVLIRDCFTDMAEAADDNKAELYQYAGDEVIFTWKTSPENMVRSIQLYFQFEALLKTRASYYLDHYGIVPEFKAGIHHGKVIRAFVNTIRKASAFHGDAINTAARIQGKCNELGCKLLVSAYIHQGISERYKTSSHGKFQLRGRNEALNLFSVNEPVKESSAMQTITFQKAARQPFTLWLNFF